MAPPASPTSTSNPSSSTPTAPMGDPGPWDLGPSVGGAPEQTPSLPPWGASTPSPSAPLTIHPGDGQACGDHHHHEPEAGAVVIQKHQPVHASLEHKSQLWASLSPVSLPGTAPFQGREQPRQW